MLPIFPVQPLRITKHCRRFFERDAVPSLSRIGEKTFDLLNRIRGSCLIRRKQTKKIRQSQNGNPFKLLEIKKMTVSADNHLGLSSERAFENTIVREIFQHRHFSRGANNCCRPSHHLESNLHILLWLVELPSQDSRRFGKDGE